jgi:hypothetical protein
MFLHALSYVTEKRPEEFNSVLRELLDRYPDTDITPIASSWLKGMAQGRQLQSGESNMRGMIWEMRLSNDSTLTAEGDAAFTLNDNDRQLLVMTFSTEQVSSNALLYEIARHNFKSFVVKDFDLEQLNFGRLGMIVIRDFDSMEELNHYRSVMANSSEFKLPAGVRPVVISDSNFKIMLSQGRSFDEYFRFLQEQNYVDTQADLLQPEEVETLQEADAAAEMQPQPEAEPEMQPEAQPEAQPTAEPEAEPEPLPEIQPTPAPTATPTAPATPASTPVIVPTPSRPTLPTYAPGSEGDDDPLLD